MSTPDLRTIIGVGASAERRVTVTQPLTVQAAYPSLPAVYATPQMIYLMELAAADAIAALLPAGWGSVGTLVDVRHLAATPVGFEVTATARVVEVRERVVRFAVTAHDGIDTIGEGTHERGVVDLTRFVAGVARKTAAAAAAGART